MTRVRVVDGGERWIWGARCAFWRQRRRGFAAAGTALWSPRSRGPGMTPGLPVRLRIRSRGWRATAQRPRSLSFSVLRGGSVRGILERVADEARRNVDLLDGLERIGIDEISHRKGQRYLTVVVDHHSGRLVWAAAGRDRKTVLAFFDALGEERCKQIELVSCDMASWIAGPVAERCPDAVRCVDPFHVIQLATDALDQVRREVWNEARRQGNMELARDLKGARFAVWKNPENLTERQQAKLAEIQKTNGPLYRAYLLKEQLRQIYRVSAKQAEKLLEQWLAWARRSRLPSFVKLAQTITVQRDGILSAVKNGLSNARIEQMNTQIRLLARQAFGFHSPRPLIALAMLKLAELCPPLPR